MTIKTKPALKLMQKWANLLGLEKWQLQLYIADQQQDAKACTRADAYVEDQPAYEHADIYLHAWQIDNDHELNAAIVHELLHCVLAEERIAMRASVNKNKLADIPHERHINQIAEALVSLEEKKNKRR